MIFLWRQVWSVALEGERLSIARYHHLLEFGPQCWCSLLPAVAWPATLYCMLDRVCSREALRESINSFWISSIPLAYRSSSLIDPEPYTESRNQHVQKEDFEDPIPSLYNIFGILDKARLDELRSAYICAGFSVWLTSCAPCSLGELLWCSGFVKEETASCWKRW